MSERKFSIGDRVDTSLWDKSVPPYARHNGGTVTAIEQRQCESGWLVTFEDDKGRNRSVCQNWLLEVPHGGE